MFKKVVSFILTGCLLISVSVTSLASAQTTTQNTQTASKKASPVGEISKETMELLDQYVKVENKQFVLDVPEKVKKQLKPGQLKIVQDYIKKTNNIIKNNKNVVYNNTTKSFTAKLPETATTSTTTSATSTTTNKIAPPGAYEDYEGVTEVRLRWWGYSVFLSKTTVKAIVLGEIAGTAALIALIPGAGWAIAGAIVGAMGAEYANSYTYRATVVQVRWDALLTPKAGINWFAGPQLPYVDYSTFWFTW